MKICPLCKKRFEGTKNFCPHDSQILELDLTSIVGTTLDGQYEIEDLLGSGGMGAVYRARHIKLNDTVAVKIMPPHVSGNPEYQKRFIREGQAARLFHHPNSVAVYDLRESSDGLLYMVLEFIEGHTLSAELKRKGRFTPVQAFAALEPIMNALQAAHEMGVIHRDLKPDNIMIGTSPNEKPIVKLLDLGVAKIQQRNINNDLTALTITGQIVGTPYYMSPEQWEGDTHIDGRADIYSLGIIFYELVAGQRPFAGKNIESLASQHGFVIATPLQEVTSDVNVAFSRAIAKAMEKDRKNRQSTVAEFADDLRKALAQEDESQQCPTKIFEEEQKETLLLQSGELATTVFQKTVTQVASPTLGSKQEPEPGSQVVKEVKPEEIKEVLPPQPFSPPHPVEPTPLKGKNLPVLVGLTMLLLAGTWFGLKQYLSSQVQIPGKPIIKIAQPPKVETVEALRWWLEITDSTESDPSVRKAGQVTMFSGQKFKIYCRSQQYGFLYLVGPGPGNAPMAFLTSKPVSQSGLTSNSITTDEDFEFPKGKGKWIQLDQTVGIDTYTVVFSRVSLGQPAFLSGSAGKQPLTKEEQLDWQNLLSQAVPITTKVETGPEQVVIITLPKDKTGEQPLIFDIKIDHK